MNAEIDNFGPAGPDQIPDMNAGNVLQADILVFIEKSRYTVEVVPEL